MPDEALQVEVAVLLRRHDETWNGLDFEALADLWDPDEPTPWYIADELGEAAVGWPECRRAWLRLAGRVKGASVHSGELMARLLTKDLALAHYVTDWRLEPIEASISHAGQSRSLAVLRKRDGRWLFTALSESAFHRSR